METYINQLRLFIDKECDAQNKQIDEIWALPLEERIELGHTLDQVTIWTVLENIDWTRRGRAFLKLKYNHSNLRPGSRIRIHKGNPLENYFCCEVIKEYNGFYEIKAAFNCNLSNIKHDSTNWIVDPDKIDLRHLLKQTVDAITRTPYGNEVYGQLKGILEPNLSNYNPNVVPKYIEKYKFNQSQAEAFTKSLQSDNYYTIQGPPGTGKTWVLAYLALELAKQGKNVLISAFTHRAINNALRKIQSVDNYNRLFKIGPVEQADDLINHDAPINNYEYFIQSPYDSLEKGLIVGASPMSLRSKRIGSLTFDVAIIDEAGQLTQPLAISIMLACRKTIWIGDHKQMPPVLIATHHNKEIARSAFECLTEKQQGTMLRTTYRMNKKINAIPSHFFYKNELESAPSIANRTLSIENIDPKFDFLTDSEKASIFIQTTHKRCKVQSKKEALVIKQLSEVLIKSGISPNDIGVVTPYRAQARLISEHLSKIDTGLNKKDTSEIIVDTVERMQGQEKEIIFFSLVLSDIEHISHGLDFFFNLNRLNVAITRAKTKMIWVGNSEIFKQLKQSHPFDRNYNTFYDIVKSLPKISTNK